MTEVRHSCARGGHCHPSANRVRRLQASSVLPSLHVLDSLPFPSSPPPLPRTSPLSQGSHLGCGPEAPLSTSTVRSITNESLQHLFRNAFFRSFRGLLRSHRRLLSRSPEFSVCATNTNKLAAPLRCWCLLFLCWLNPKGVNERGKQCWKTELLCERASLTQCQQLEALSPDACLPFLRNCCRVSRLRFEP